MENISAKDIIFNIKDIGNKESTGWLPVARATKLFILDYLKEHRSKPYATATLTNEVFSILADNEDFLKREGKLGADGYFFKLNKYFKDEWGITDDTVSNTTAILNEMGWVTKEIREEYVNNHPQNTPYYKFNHDKIIQDIRSKFPSTYKLF